MQLRAEYSGISLEEKLRRLYDLDEQMLLDPFAIYTQMREERPVLRINGVVIVSRYEDVKAVFRDTDTFSNKRQLGSRVTQRRASLSKEDLALYDHLIEHDTHHIGLSDPPEHTHLRRFVNQAFSANAISAMRETVVGIANDILDEIEMNEGDQFDFSLYSYRLPFSVVCRMLEIPDDQQDNFKKWAAATRRGLGTNYENLHEAYDSIRHIENYVNDLVRRRRAEPSDPAGAASSDLVSNLIAIDTDGSRLSDAELVTMFSVMLTSGNTNDMISNAVIALAQFPDQRDLLIRQPELMRGAVDEFFRFAPPAHGVHRVAMKECDIAGFPVEAGETVRLLVASANHDSDVFGKPDELDIRRANARQQLDFGFGLHTCLGQWLARMDVEVGLTELYRRFPRLTVETPIHYRREYQFRGPAHLRVNRR